MTTLKVHLKDKPSDAIECFYCSAIELVILQFLGQDEMTAPAISRKSNGKIGVQSVYVLLKRLEKRGLVSRKEVLIPVEDIKVKRVLHQATFDILLEVVS